MRGITFYDSHPFDWTQGYSLNELESTLSPLLGAFIHCTPPDARVLDLGCGPGRVMACMAVRRLHAVGLDLSIASVRLMMQRTGRPGAVGNGLMLPFREESIDRIISDGVLHHTPNPFAAFAEACRVLKPGGVFYLAVYKPGGHYQKLYRFPGATIRGLTKHPAGKALVHMTFLPLYYLAHLVKSRGKRSWLGATNLFYDYFVTPIVEFLSQDDLAQWCKKCGVEIVDYDPNPSLNVHSFVIRKP